MLKRKSTTEACKKWVALAELVLNGYPGTDELQILDILRALTSPHLCTFKC